MSFVCFQGQYINLQTVCTLKGWSTVTWLNHSNTYEQCHTTVSQLLYTEYTHHARSWNLTSSTVLRLHILLWSQKWRTLTDKIFIDTGVVYPLWQYIWRRYYYPGISQLLARSPQFLFMHNHSRHEVERRWSNRRQKHTWACRGCGMHSIHAYNTYVHVSWSVMIIYGMYCAIIISSAHWIYIS